MQHVIWTISFGLIKMFWQSPVNIRNSGLKSSLFWGKSKTFSLILMKYYLSYWLRMLTSSYYPLILILNFSVELRLQIGGISSVEVWNNWVWFYPITLPKSNTCLHCSVNRQRFSNGWGQDIRMPKMHSFTSIYF